MKLGSMFRGAAVPALVLVGSLAEAAGVAAVDVTDVSTGITNQLTSIATVGAVALGIVVAVVAYRWIRRVIK